MASSLLAAGTRGNSGAGAEFRSSQLEYLLREINFIVVSFIVADLTLLFILLLLLLLRTRAEPVEPVKGY